MADRTTANGDGDEAVPSLRADIVAAATRVFSERGYHGASMDDVADVLGIRKPSLTTTSARRRTCSSRSTSSSSTS